MSIRPITLLLTLMLFAIGGGIWLTRMQPSPGEAPRGGGSSSRADAAKNEEAGLPDQRMANLENMVVYLQDQVKALENENKGLRDQLSKKREKVEVTPCTPPAKPMTDDDAPDFTGIGIELIKVREIHALPVNKEDAQRADVEKRILSWLTQGLPEGYGKAQGRAFAALGAIPEPVDTLALKAGLLSHQLGGWYDAGDATLHLVPGPEGGLENALALAYAELFRAYGDRLFPKEGKVMTTDERLARECLLGGDTSFTRLMHSLKNPAKGGGGGVGEDPDDPSRSVPIPNFLREMALIPFNMGMDFVKALHSIGEFEQVNAAYERPPLTGAEVLDSQIYLAEQAPAMPPVVWTDVRLNGQPPLWDDRLGVLCMALLLKQHVADPIAVEAVSGWANDRCLVYAADGKPRDHVAWQTMWKDTNSADGFFSAMRQSLTGRYKGIAPANDAPKGVFRLAGPERHVILQRTNGGKGVLYIDAADAAAADALAGKLTSK